MCRQHLFILFPFLRATVFCLVFPFCSYFTCIKCIFRPNSPCLVLTSYKMMLLVAKHSSLKVKMEHNFSSLWCISMRRSHTGYKFLVHTSVVSKTKHSKKKTEAPSTQMSKTKHPKLENEDPLDRKRRPKISKTKHPKLENEDP